MKFAVVVAVCLVACGVSAQPAQDATTTAPKGSESTFWEKLKEILHLSKKPTIASPPSPGKREVNDPNGRCSFLYNNNADRHVTSELFFQCLKEVFGAFAMPVPAMEKREVAVSETSTNAPLARDCLVDGQLTSIYALLKCFLKVDPDTFSFINYILPVFDPVMGKREVTETSTNAPLVRDCGGFVNGKPPSFSVMFQCYMESNPKLLSFLSSLAMPVPAGK